CRRLALDAAMPARFWAKVNKTEGCWLWTSAIKGNWVKYGAFSPRRNVQCYAHRLSWELAFGPIPAGMFVLHRCDNGLCVRPDHLKLGTHEDNMADMVAKGRSNGGNQRVLDGRRIAGR